MSLPTSSLEAIQQAGAAVSEADKQLKQLVTSYAERVHVAVLSNPYHLGNDNLFENWKVVARVSQTLAAMEEELRKAYQVLGELRDEAAGSATFHALDAPAPDAVASQAEAGTESSNVTDVKIKRKPKSAAARKQANADAGASVRPGREPAESKPVDAKPAVAKSRVAGKSPGGKAGRIAPGGNAAKLMAYFERALNSRKFVGISQTAVSKEAGIPLGSMTAAIKQLLASGKVIAGATGQYKLGK